MACKINVVYKQILCPQTAWLFSKAISKHDDHNNLERLLLKQRFGHANALVLEENQVPQSLRNKVNPRKPTLPTKSTILTTTNNQSNQPQHVELRRFCKSQQGHGPGQLSELISRLFPFRIFAASADVRR